MARKSKLWRDDAEREKDFALFDEIEAGELAVIAREEEAMKTARELGATGDMPTREQVQEMIDIAKRRGELRGRLKAALVAGDKLRALALAREYCGLPPEETTH